MDRIDILVLGYTIIIMIFAYWLRSERITNRCLMERISEIVAISKHQTMLLDFLAMPKLDENTPEMARMASIDKAKRLFDNTKGFLMAGKPEEHVAQHMEDFRQLCIAIGFNDDEIAVITGEDYIKDGEKSNAIGKTVFTAGTETAADAPKNIINK